MGVVNGPPLSVPPVGLIAALGPAGGPYLDPPDDLPVNQWPPMDVNRPLAIPGDDPGPDSGSSRTPPQRWWDEASYLPEQFCGRGAATDPCAADLAGNLQVTPDTVTAKSFYVTAGDTCSSFGWQAHDFRGRATRALLATESAQIAEEFWTGARAIANGWPNPFLSSAALSDTITASPQTPAQALDMLEQALASCASGQRGAIHCTPQLGSAWSNLGNTLRNVNGLILTYRGTIIVPDAGYDGSGPGGTPAASGSQWAYATLLPTVRRGPVELTPGSFEEALDRRMGGPNTITWYAQRLANVTLPECCVFAAQVDLPLALVGGAS